MDGMELLATLVSRWPDIPVLMLTGFGTIPIAVEAMKLGAADFMLKPFRNAEIVYCVKKALARTEKLDSEPIQTPMPQSPLLSASSAMAAVQALIRKAASGNSTVLVRGESGTGKELAAREIHQLSPRSSGPMVKLHCGALPDTLLESELFGYEKGAFTGATQRKPGRVELAEGGTLFLDEIGDITPAVQMKLLRLLQEREFERLGGTTTYKANIRVVAATHQPLEMMVQQGKFRADLFYRLNVVELWLPPLRARSEDIGLLARHFFKALAVGNGKAQFRLDEDAISVFERHSWPGNVRELQNVIERLVILADAPVITRKEVERAAASWISTRDAEPHLAASLRKSVSREEVLEALSRASGNRSLAARLLRISRRSLYNKLAEFELT
jgi:two-component system, NtrC family, response regulator AtoC